MYSKKANLVRWWIFESHHLLKTSPKQLQFKNCRLRSLKYTAASVYIEHTYRQWNEKFPEQLRNSVRIKKVKNWNQQYKIFGDKITVNRNSRKLFAWKLRKLNVIIEMKDESWINEDEDNWPQGPMKTTMVKCSSWI